ncbi:hypothetical protein BGX28_003080 [Mortierella sp. GBA30]|nr:hypothetical protein BGX28_003080 [Mortierella sp. GBA30]
MTYTIKITVHKAEHLDDVEHFGKNDPYVKATLNFKDKDSYQKTSVKKNAGRHAEWNETLTLDNYIPSEHHELYVEIFDSDMGVDPPIGFCAIPLRQINDAPNKVFRGQFQLYTPKGKEKGTVSLTVAVVQAGHAVPQSNLPEVKGISQIVTDHQHRMQSSKRNEKFSDIGMTAAAIGGLIFAKKAHDASKKTHEP